MGRGSHAAIPALAVVALCPVGAPLSAQHPRAIEELQQLFDTDPATAFEEAWRVFQAEQADEDLDGMAALLRCVAPQASRYLYARVLDDMVDALAASARASGKWELVAEAYGARREINHLLANYFEWPMGYAGHGGRDAWDFVRRAEALEKAGQLDEAAAAQAAHFREDIERGNASCRPAVPPAQPSHMENYTGPRYYPRVWSVVEAYNEARDADAVAQSLALIGDLHDPENPWHAGNALGQIAPVISLRGGQAVLPRVQAMWRPGGGEWSQASWQLANIAIACAEAWSGRDDVYRDGYYWAMRQVAADPDGPAPMGAEASFALKLHAFGRTDEAVSVVRQYLGLVSRAPAG